MAKLCFRIYKRQVKNDQKGLSKSVIISLFFIGSSGLGSLDFVNSPLCSLPFMRSKTFPKLQSHPFPKCPRARSTRFPAPRGARTSTGRRVRAPKKRRDAAPFAVYLAKSLADAAEFCSKYTSPMSSTA